MGWINMGWGLFQIPDAPTSLPHKAAFALNKVVKQKCASLFPSQLTIGGVPTMLSLEAPFDFMATNWGI
jgi:hypothetical protein